ncbi:O-antigen ligase family protein [Asticcacaulis machinosus]|uniref:O-antigen ligase n=1 Tax=Asticcacaulis machinosus TaxID=2984211 RepID=A0ABT5HN09_9CAUL|nr:O-antigen ligase [Asticcacaulis machinosus]MDC7677628.1 O-antigen ligase [Asticcacaulis machinosus]
MTAALYRTETHTATEPADRWAVLIRAAEVTLTIFCVFMFTEALWAPLFAPNQENGGETAWMRLLWLPVYGATALLCALRISSFLRVIPALFATGIFVGLAYLSSVWSIAPDVSSRRAIALAFTSLFGLYLGARYKGSDLTQIVGVTFVGLAVGSYLAAILYPKMGIAHDINAGAWRGLWHEKNQMAAMMVLGFIAACASAFQVPERRKAWIGAAVMIFVLVVLSRSKTSLLACLLSLGAMPVLVAIQRGGLISVVIVWCATTAATLGTVLFMAMPDVILKALGKDPTLTGRTQIWEALGRLSEERPWLGYGYKAFWAEGSVPALIVRRETHWPVPSAHNGWLDLLVQLGWVGVITFAVFLAICFLCALFRFSRVNDGFFSVLILCLFSFLILSESFILGQNSLIWVLFVAAAARLTANRLQES